MVGALIDTSNPWIPFIGGTLVGGIILAPVIDALGGQLGSRLGGSDDGEEGGANVAYAYHSMKQGGLNKYHSHGPWGHMHRHKGVHQHPMPPHPPVLPPMKRLPARSRDFGKEYGDVQQTYTNHLWINDKTPYL